MKAMHGLQTAVPAQSATVSRWIMDTGSGHDLIGRADLTPAQARGIEPTALRLTLNTANGPLRAKEEVDIKVQSLGVTVSPLLLAVTPQRCCQWAKGA